MVGEMSVYSKFHAQESGGSPEVMLEVKGLCKKNNFADVSFSLMKGEVLGITGLLGSGRTELASALFGILPADSGTIYLENKQVRILSVQDAVTNGIAYVPEDRLTQGLVMNYPQRDNIVLATLANFTKNGLLDEPTITEVSQGWVSSLKIKTDDHFKKVSTLSGGNQQKVVLAKWLEMNPKVLILDGPTVGVDVGAKAGIFKIIHEMVEKLGMSVILISDEIKEITANCQRVLVMQNGRICSCLEKAEEIDDSNIQAILDMQKKSV